MDGDPQLFDLEAGQAAAGLGQSRALAAHDVQAWKDLAREVIQKLADSGKRFTVDDVIAEVGLPRDPAMNANNAVGAILNGARQAGRIESVDRRPTHRATNHGRYVTVWKGTKR